LPAPTPHDEPPRRPIDRTYPRGDADRGIPADRPVPRDLDEAALGGADAVPATPGVPEHGADVGDDERRRTPRTNPGTLAQVSAGKGSKMWLSIAGIAVVLILLAIMFF
jgi:hypothetical protein